MAAGECIALFLNNETRFDMIKWTGALGCNIIDNVFIRMTGWYFFQIALITPALLFKLQ
jgi:hypothetical protein